MRGALLLKIAVVLAVVAAAPAFAKGPSQAVIEGPGLAHPVSFREPSSPTIGPYLASLIQNSGFFIGLSCHKCASRLVQPPAGVLGPRYTITYTMTLDRQPSGDIVQYVYPYAEPRPVTHMPRGQAYWTSGKTTGGWYLARPKLTQVLIDVGLPATAADATRAPATPFTTPEASGRLPALPLWITAGVAILGIATIVRRRRHPAPPDDRTDARPPSASATPS